MVFRICEELLVLARILQIHWELMNVEPDRTDPPDMVEGMWNQELMNEAHPQVYKRRPSDSPLQVFSCYTKTFRVCISQFKPRDLAPMFNICLFSYYKFL